ncbi:MAG: type II 3-dehydroquinate dehydratase [Burkholderiaceae bacterium]|jgi:3-dehydroquinate dehydratase-2|nr:type II 3-dehydroquinate dehydratase [Burkholderiaceae bacterium]MEB2319297.1 type II 3-dehydroquinate dehydratase [Pseudomonadota bacterium]
MSKTIWAIHGPNLNLLGSREPDVYGRTTLAEIDRGLARHAAGHGHAFASFQSNHEGAIVDRIHAARESGVDFILINPGAFTHTSVAIRDAFAAVAVPFIEIHISNVHRRESFRRRSWLSDLAEGVITGLGPSGYRLALEFAIERLEGADWPGAAGLEQA